MAATKILGVYVQEVPGFPASVTQVESALPAFIGYTQQAKKTKVNDLHLVPTLITSFAEYKVLFGGPEMELGIQVIIIEDVDKAKNPVSLKADASFGTKGQSAHNMFYSLRIYFENGGGSCYIVSVGKYKNTVFGHTYNTVALQSGLDVLASIDKPTLIVIPEGQHINTDVNYYVLQNNVLAQCEAKGRFAIVDVYNNAGTNTENINNFRAGIGMNNLKRAAAYYPNLVTILNYSYDKSKVSIVHKRTINGKSAATIRHGKNKLDDPTLAGTVYYSASVDAINKMPLVLPPCAAIAGVYVYVDSIQGVWKAPANISLNAVKDLATTLTQQEMDGMNIDIIAGKSINSIRPFTGKGILVWGARTLAGNDMDWKYVSVRRFCNMVEESIKISTAAFVFEPNNIGTWTKIRAMTENYLTILWRQGALQGAKLEQALFVRVGLGQTMTAQDILDGRMIVQIGMAVVRPAEFILLSFSQQMQK